MFHPFADDKKNNQENNQENNKENNTIQPYEGKPENQAEWQGSTYHYAAPQQTSPTYSWEHPPAPEAKTPKKKRGIKKFLMKAVAAVLVCVIISGGSIAGFTALVNNGYIQLNSTSSDSTTAAFTITKLVGSTTSTSTTTGQLTLQEIAAKVVPSVVCIQNYQVSQSSKTTQRSQQGNSDDNNTQGTATTDSTEEDSSVSPASEGSGIIATTDGYIITNAHVVEDATSLKVVLSTGKTYSAKLVGSDSVTDLAVIKIEATGLTAAEFGSSDDLKVADTVMAVGNPGGLEFNSSVTVGYVSALNREITNSETGYTMKCIQTDAAINPGNSGGALVNMYGQVIGINSSKIVATGYEGLGFSIPISIAQPIISDLKQYGYVKDRAVLGVSGQFIDAVTARFYNLPTGMYVASITSSEVTNAGIQKGDIITKIDGKSVTSQNVITSAVTAKKPGDTVTLSVTNSQTGNSFTATVKLIQSTGK
ncbi:MAG: trypsin-like serine protease [Clostridiales bacterium]|nr:trypsin-like serine protease [Clostridiales bacterium]